MDDLQMINELFEPAPPSRHAVTGGRAALLALARDDAARLARRQRARRAPARAGLAAIFAGLAAVAAAIAVALAGAVVPNPAPDHGTRARGPAEQPARAFLLAMAAKVSHEHTGRYWCLAETGADLNPVGRGTVLLPSPDSGGRAGRGTSASHEYQYSIMVAARYENCFGDRGAYLEYAFSQQLGARPATPADRAAWRHDGSPRQWKNPLNVGYQPIPAARGPRNYGSGPALRTGQPWGNSLPSNPAKLRMVLLTRVDRLPIPPHMPLRMFERIRIAPIEQSTGLTLAQIRTEQLVYWAEWVMEAPVASAVRAAAYQVLAGIPGIRIKSGVEAPGGRTGTAFWLAGKNSTPLPGITAGQGANSPFTFSYSSAIGSVEIVDPATGFLLARETVTTKRVDGFAPRTLMDYSAYNFGWANTLPRGTRMRPPK